MPRLNFPRKGDRVAFTVPEGHSRAGQRVEGIVKTHPRQGLVKVVELSGFARGGEIPPSAPGLPPGRSYDVEETTWSVPRSIAIEIIRRRTS